MSGGDFYVNEQSIIISVAIIVVIEYVVVDGIVIIFKDGLVLEVGEIMDSIFMSKNVLV